MFESYTNCSLLWFISRKRIKEEVKFGELTYERKGGHLNS